MSCFEVLTLMQIATRFIQTSPSTEEGSYATSIYTSRERKSQFLKTHAATHFGMVFGMAEMVSQAQLRKPEAVIQIHVLPSSRRRL